jgi:hypothetical protein
LVLPLDLWECGECVSSERNVQALGRQGFELLVVPDRQQAVADGVRPSFTAAGLEVLSGPTHSQRFLPLLPELLLLDD